MLNEIESKLGTTRNTTRASLVTDTGTLTLLFAFSKKSDDLNQKET